MKKMILLIIFLSSIFIVVACGVKNEGENNIIYDNTDKRESGEFVTNINVIINGKRYSVTLEDNDTSRKLVELLPLDVIMKDLNGNEKYIYLASSFPVHSIKPGHIEKGDIMLFDNSCIVIFYKSFDTSFTYTKIGHIDNLDDLGSEDVNVSFEK